MANAPQSFERHTRVVTGYHQVTWFLILVALFLSAARLVRAPSAMSAETFILSLAVALTAYYARSFPVGVQDRLIRLEERLRMERLLPDDLKARIPEFTTAQLIALRFASDAELAELARRVLDEGLVDGKSIKALVKDWRPDHQRV